MIEIGKGLCRGQSWTSAKWPVDKGHLTAQECADSCARKKGCTAFDLSNKKGKTFACFLYGHTDVEPAKALKGNCYTYKGNTHTEDLANEEVLDELEDKELDLKGISLFDYIVAKKYEKWQKWIEYDDESSVFIELNLGTDLCPSFENSYICGNFSFFSDPYFMSNWIH